VDVVFAVIALRAMEARSTGWNGVGADVAFGRECEWGVITKIGGRGGIEDGGTRG